MSSNILSNPLPLGLLWPEAIDRSDYNWKKNSQQCDLYGGQSIPDKN